MSLISEILDRLSGVAAVRERLAETGQRVSTLTDWVVDHEKRLTRLETVIAVGRQTKRLPKKPREGS